MLRHFQLEQSKASSSPSTSGTAGLTIWPTQKFWRQEVSTFGCDIVVAFSCCNGSAQSFAKPPKFLVLSLVLSPAGQIDQLLAYPRAAFDSNTGRGILSDWLPLNPISFMHVRCCIQDRPIVLIDESHFQ